ncbi:hypothetical protein KI809_19245 [Geobacter pelophilus]|uniref:Self-protective colicin-like immunity n=1 Tax=Geoanaerobacter pelophilus TaxID=60036 RepID=A0AAW4L6M4_9BACT|nr:hypothetical protein [Geoanaerobacter pelophilus]MBT0666449.1 hypothetical protein [Geoanaerobacter pelophilus]
MELFEKLRAVALQQNLDNEFPSWLLAEVMTIADEPDLYEEKVHLIELLIDQIDNFDPYAGTGCFDTSVGAETIQSTIRRVLN